MSHVALSAAAGGMLLLAITSAHGQEVLAGTYTGEMTATSPFPGKRPSNIKVQLEITSAENGVAKGQGTSSSPACAGNMVPIVGKQDGNKLEIRAADGRGSDASCSMAYSFTINGKTLEGINRSGFAVKLTRQ